MTKKLRFLHTGDIHLGAAVRGLGDVSDAWAERLMRSVPEAFDRMIRTALESQVDFVVMAGDAFDATKASLGDMRLFFDGLGRLHEAGIPTYLVTGNHDPFTSWEREVDLLPPSAHLMGVGEPTFQLFQRDGEPLCLIGARSYYNQTWSQDKDIAEGISRAAAEQALAPEQPEAPRAPFSIGVIHTGLDVDRRKAPTAEADLLARGMDYWACGHLHKCLVRPSWHDPRIAFPGCLQAVNVRETGRRGCLLVTLEAPEADSGAPMAGAAQAAVEFIPTASVVFQDLQVDAGPFPTLTDLERHIQAELFRVNGEARCEDMLVRVQLTGATALYDYLRQPTVLARMRKRLSDAYPSFWCDRLENRTRPAQEPAQDAGDQLFSSLVSHMAQEQRRRGDEMVNYVQGAFVASGITVPDSLSRRMDDYEAQAELLALDLLRGDEA